MPRIPLNQRDALSDPPYCLEEPESLAQTELELLDAESDELQHGTRAQVDPAPAPSPELKRLLQELPAEPRAQQTPLEPLESPLPLEEQAPNILQTALGPNAAQATEAPYAAQASKAPYAAQASNEPQDCVLNDVLAARRHFVKRTTTQEISLWAEEFTLSDPVSDARRAAQGALLSDHELTTSDLDPRQESAILNALDAAEEQHTGPGSKGQREDLGSKEQLDAPILQAQLPDEAAGYVPAASQLSGAQVLARQARAAALEDLSLNKTLGLKRSEVMLNGLRAHLTWALFSFGSLALSFFCLAALIAQSGRPALQPYVVTVDRQGVVLNRGPLTPASEALSPALVAAELADFVRNVRMVTPDKTLQRELMTKAYALVAPNSKVFFDLDAYFNAHNPLSNKAPYAVSVDILNVIATGEHTLQIDWREQSHAGAADTALTRPDASYERTMRALVSYEQDSALTQGSAEGSERLLLLNPLGLIVTEFVVSDVMA